MPGRDPNPIAVPIVVAGALGTFAFLMLLGCSADRPTPRYEWQLVCTGSGGKTTFQSDRYNAQPLIRERQWVLRHRFHGEGFAVEVGSYLPVPGESCVARHVNVAGRQQER